MFEKIVTRVSSKKEKFPIIRKKKFFRDHFASFSNFVRPRKMGKFSLFSRNFASICSAKQNLRNATENFRIFSWNASFTGNPNCHAYHANWRGHKRVVRGHKGSLNDYFLNKWNQSLVYLGSTARRIIKKTVE